MRIFTDGACLGNPGPGGWAWAIEGGVDAVGGEPATTNQRMELTAVLEALRSNPGDVEIVSDSTYVINCFKDGWWRKWIRNGWRNSKGEPVANQDIWKELVALVDARKDEISFTWVKGHAGDPGNERVDGLATAQARRFA